MTNREIDALVATEVMGWRRTDDPVEFGAAFVEGGPVWTITYHGDLLVARRKNAGPWLPTEDISAAINDVVEKMAELGFDFRCGQVTDRYWAEFRDYQEPLDAPIVRGGKASVDPRDGKLPLAICYAALSTLGIALPEGLR